METICPRRSVAFFWDIAGWEGEMKWFSKKEDPVDEKAAASSGLRLFIQKMDPGGVRASLSAGANPNGGSEDDISPLVLAATSFVSSLPMHRRAQREIIKTLLEAGADPKWGGRNGQSPFEVAVKKGWEDIMELMVAKGHPVETIEGSVMTPLQVALTPADYRGQSLIPTVQCLLRLGADINNPGKTRRPPLALALHQADTLRQAEDYELLIKAMLDAGASRDALSPNGETIPSLMEKAGLPHLA